MAAAASKVLRVVSIIQVNLSPFWILYQGDRSGTRLVHKSYSRLSTRMGKIASGMWLGGVDFQSTWKLPE